MTPSIRLARVDEFDVLNAIELDATVSLVEAGVVFLDGPSATPRPLLEHALAEGLLFVAVDAADRPLGFLAAHERDGGLYIGEVDVLKRWQRRGIGRALMNRAIDAARVRRLWGAMLTTDRFVSFNAPFYASLGFCEVADDAAPPHLARVLAAERTAEHQAARRAGMILKFENP